MKATIDPQLKRDQTVTHVESAFVKRGCFRRVGYAQKST